MSPTTTQPGVALPLRSMYAGGTQERRKSVEFFSFDRDYLQRLTDGDSETERHFVAYFSPLLLLKLKQRLRSRDELEDLRQEVFLRVLRSLRQGPGVQHAECLGAYVHSVCNNVVLEYLRSHSRSQQWNERAIEPQDPGMGIECELVTAERKNQVRVLIDEMAPRDRSLLQAIFLDERDKDTVCREQGVRRDYLRVLLFRAKKRFRQIIESQTQIVESQTQIVESQTQIVEPQTRTIETQIAARDVTKRNVTNLNDLSQRP